MANADPLDEVASAIADGRPVEWPAAETSAGPRDLDALAQMRIIAEIARLHRGSDDPLTLEPGASPHETGIAPGARTPLFRWGSLDVIERLGAGSFGEVYRAVDASLQREVALKLLRPETSPAPRAADAIIHEGQLLARVRHPNVMAVYGAQHNDGRVGIWGELLHGRTLADIVRQDGPLSAQEASLFADAVCRALTAVHRAGLLHRDIKAQNVMRESGGRIVLMDFGLGRETDMPEAMKGLELAGTPLYLAPELFQGEPASAQSDIYSVGVLLFYLVTGSFPVLGDSIDAVGRNHRAAKSVRLQDLRSDLPAPFLQVVERALAAQRESRFDSAGALQAALASAQSMAVSARPAPERQRRLWAALGVTFLIAAVASALLWRSTGRGEQVELTFVAPQGIAFTEGSRNVPTVAPDGASVAFLATDDTGGVQLWVRTLADSKPRLMQNTRGATRPFWSPDGRSLAYFAGDGLYRVEVSGADPRLLAKGTESRGGSWGRDGTLLLALDPHKGLEIMPAVENGRRTQVTTVDPSRHQSQHMWPQFLPDGKHFIFFVLSDSDDFEGVYLGSIDGQAPKLLVKSHTSAVSMGGALLYTQNNALFAKALDIPKGALTGEARAINLSVDATYDWLLLLSASENGTVVYARPDLRQLVWYDFQGHDLEKLGRPDRYRNPVISPNGRTLVAERYNVLGKLELIKFDLTRDVDPQPLSPLPARPKNPAWAPDGRLAFSASQKVYEDIYVMPNDGSGAKLLVESDQDKEPTSWSPDGRQLAYVVFEVGAYGRNQDLWVASSENGRGHALVANPAAIEVNAQFAPNPGGWIAYLSFENRVTHLLVRKAADSKPYDVAADAYDPQWRSSKELLYLDRQGYLWSATIPDDPSKGIQAMRLFHAPVKTPGTSRHNYALAADGRRILFNALLPESGPPTFSVILNWRNAGL